MGIKVYFSLVCDYLRETANIDCTRSVKYRSKLHIFRSFVIIFAVNCE